MSVSDETIKLILEIQKSGSVPEAIKALEDFRDKAIEASHATEKLDKTGVNMGQSLLQTGRIVQDFAQGGLGGILNNIEGATMALGLGSGLAGVLTVVGVAALTAGPSIKSFFQGIIDGANKIPESMDAVDNLTDKLKSNKETLDEMRKAQSLTNTELAEFNRLTGENIELEKRLTQAKKERQEQEKLTNLRAPTEVDAEKTRAEELQTAFGGQQGQIEDLANTGLQGQIDRLTKQIQSYPSVHPDDKEGIAKRTAVYKQWYGELYRLKDLQKRGVKSVLSGAMVGGKEGDVRIMADLLPSLGPDAGFQKGFEGVLPGADDAWNAANEAFEEGNRRAHDARMKREAQARADKRSAAKADKVAKEEHDREAKNIEERIKTDVDINDRSQKEGLKFSRQVSEAGAKALEKNEKSDKAAEEKAWRQQEAEWRARIQEAEKFGRDQQELLSRQNEQTKGMLQLRHNQGAMSDAQFREAMMVIQGREIMMRQQQINNVMNGVQ